MGKFMPIRLTALLGLGILPTGARRTPLDRGRSRWRIEREQAAAPTTSRNAASFSYACVCEK